MQKAEVAQRFAPGIILHSAFCLELESRAGIAPASAALQAAA